MGTAVHASDGVTVGSGQTKAITAFTVCKSIANNSATGKALYVATNTALEWSSFYNLPPSGVTATACQTIQNASWVSLGNVLPQTIANSQTAVIGGFAYIFGGRISSTGVTPAIYRASTANMSSWTLVGNLPGPSHSGQLYNDGTYLYLFGGRSGETPGDGTYLNTIYKAPVANPIAWVDTGALMAGKLAYSQLVIPGDGYMYLLGGSPSYQVYSGEIYRAPVSNPLTWVDTGVSLPVTLTTSQAMVIGNFIYLFGGRTGNASYVTTIYRAPTSNPLSWTAVGNLPVGFAFSSLKQVGSTLYLMGGYNGSSLTSVYKADVSTPLSWSLDPAALPAGFDSSHPQIIGNNIYLLAGGNNSSWATQLVYRATLIP